MGPHLRTRLVQIQKAASTSQIRRFETEWLAEANLAALADPDPSHKARMRKSRCAAA
jgi:hypothetical protein